jgi:hypothetical protein
LFQLPATGRLQFVLQVGKPLQTGGITALGNCSCVA